MYLLEQLTFWLTTLWTIWLRMPNSVDPDEMGLMMSHLIWMLNSVDPYEMVRYDNGRTCSCIGHAEPRLTLTITKTCLYNLDPLKPHFYIVKLRFTGVYIFFLISAQKHRLWVLVRTVLTSTHNLCFVQKYEKYQNFLSENFHFFCGKIFNRVE